MRESKALTGGFLRETLISDHGLLPFYEVNKEQVTVRIFGVFIRDAQSFGRLDADSRVEFNNSRPPSTWTSVLQFSSFLHGDV